MSSINNIHDKLFRETMSRKEVASDFLRNYLPDAVIRHIDFDTLRIRKDSFVDPELGEHYSDLLYAMRFKDGLPGFVYFLFEHKSTPDRFTALQLLRYMLEIWELHRKQDQSSKSNTLPLIVPIVVYHGKARGSAPRLEELIQPPDPSLSAYIPDFACEFHDFSPASEQQIKGRITLRLLLSCLRAKNEPDNVRHVFKIFKLLSELDDSAPSLQWLQIIFRYVLQVMDISSKEVQNMAHATLSAGKEDTIMTIAEQLHQDGWKQGQLAGIEQGIEQGMKNGLLQGRHAVLERLLRKRFGEVVDGAWVQEKLGAAPLELLDIWAERILDAETLEQVFAE